MYIVTLRSQTVGECVEVRIYDNETEIVLGPDDGVKDDQIYVILVTAVNAIGNVTSYSSNITLGKCNIIIVCTSSQDI